MKLLGALLRIVESLTLLCLRILIGFVKLLARAAMDLWQHRSGRRHAARHPGRAFNPPAAWRNPWRQPRPRRRRRRRRNWVH